MLNFIYSQAAWYNLQEKKIEAIRMQLSVYKKPKVIFSINAKSFINSLQELSKAFSELGNSLSKYVTIKPLKK